MDADVAIPASLKEEEHQEQEEPEVITTISSLEYVVEISFTSVVDLPDRYSTSINSDCKEPSLRLDLLSVSLLCFFSYN